MRAIIGEAAGLPRTPPHRAGPGPAFSPPLVRLLAQWQAGGTPAARPATHAPPAGLAERLGQWLDWTDAITLSAVLHQPASAQAAAPASPVDTAALGNALARLQAEQARAIGTDPVFLLADASATADFSPYRRACQARQRAMATATAALRARLRSVLSGASPALARLALLDATLEAALAERARHLLGGVVAHVEQRFLRARQAAAPRWLAGFHQDMQRALLAELDLRLQPAQGLLDALTQEQPA